MKQKYRHLEEIVITDQWQLSMEQNYLNVASFFAALLRIGTVVHYRYGTVNISQGHAQCVRQLLR